MTPKRRSPGNRDLPEGLVVRNLRGKERYRYRYPDGKDVLFPSGTSRNEAIRATAIYNGKYRNNDVSKLLDNHVNDRYSKPLATWLPKVLERFKTEEAPGESKLDRFMRGYNRLYDDFGGVLSKDFSLEHVNIFLDKYYASVSASEYNRALSFLTKVGAYLMDMSAMIDNPAARKKRKPKQAKIRKRHTYENYVKMLDYSRKNSDWYYFYIAMSLTLQTTQGVNEIANLKYSDAKWLDTPINNGSYRVYGHLFIHRKKTQEHDESRVKYPITDSLKQIIEESRADRVVCPYIVHRIPEKRHNKLSKGCTHPFQVTNNFLSRAFSALRDEMGLYDHLPFNERPTYHEMRATAADRFNKLGINPQERMAHKREKSTQIYLDGHDEWIVPEPAEIRWESS